MAAVAGLENVRYEELLAFDSGAYGIAFDLRSDELGAVLLAGGSRVREGDGVVGLRRLPELPVGPEALGRVLDPLGNPLDEGPPLGGERLFSLFRPAPEIIQRQSVSRTLWTGVMAIDAAIPIGRGQRELIVGDRNVGKTALAIDFVAAQRPGDVACVYVMIGQPMSRVRALRDTLERAGCLSNTAIIAAYASDSPGLQYLAPLAGASLAESFRDSGGNALVVYDDLTKH
ncbi:MAG: F0F1 ATP synthase subunit alpha, partial [Planctomycetales bacterium]|nr:F0F1 ATP synthase subunit alpha [Planctomycetales bacterium]